MEKMPKELGKFLFKEFRKIPGLLGIAVVGSVTNETFDKFSDIDVVALVKNPIKKMRGRKKFQGNNIDIIITTPKKAKEYFLRDMKLTNRPFATMLSAAHIIYSKNEILPQLVRKAKRILNGKVYCTQRDIARYKYFIEDFLSDAERDAGAKDWLSFHLNADQMIMKVLEFHLKKRGILMPKIKRFSAFLKQKDARLNRLLDAFYKKRTLEEKQKQLKKIAIYAVERSGGFLKPGYWI